MADKKGILESIANISRESSHTVNHLGQEARSVGNALGGEEGGAALNVAGTGAVIMLGLVAGGSALAVRRIDNKAKEFYGKLDSYGGLGIPMDENCKPLTTVMFGTKVDAMKKDGKVMSSVELIRRHVGHNQDTLLRRDLHGNVWDIFLFSRQMVKNGVAHGIGGKYPPRLDIPLDILNINSTSFAGISADFDALRKEMQQKGVIISQSASSAADRAGGFNINATNDGFEHALKILGKEKYAKNETFQKLRQVIEEHVHGAQVLSFHAPKLETTVSGLGLNELSPADLKELFKNFSDNGVALNLTNVDLSNVASANWLSRITGVDITDPAKLESLMGSVITERKGAMVTLDTSKLDINGPAIHELFQYTGGVEICGRKTDLGKVLSDIKHNGTSKGPDAFAKLRNSLKLHLDGKQMTDFTREYEHLLRSLNGLDAIKFVSAGKGRYIVQTEHGLEDLVQLLMAADRYPGGWDSGIKKELRDFTENLEIRPDAGAFFCYGEKQGASGVDRTLNTVVVSEEMAGMANRNAPVQPGEPLFKQQGQDGRWGLTITHYNDAERQVFAAEDAREFQRESRDALQISAQKMSDVAQQLKPVESMSPEIKEAVEKVAADMIRRDPSIALSDAMEKATQEVMNQIRNIHI